MGPVSIVVITLNEEKRIGRLLNDLSKQTHQEFEVILVDSNSEDNTRQVAAAFEASLPKLTIHKMETRGVSLGRNTGAAMAQYERILFLDADVRLESNFLANAISQLEEQQLEVAGVYMGAKNLPLVHKLGYGLFNLGLFITQYTFPTAVGACIFSTKRVHNEIGGFDLAITLCEDCDYVKRASKTWRFRFLKLTFGFDPRRLDQDGVFKMGATYLKANVRRFFFGEMRNNEMEYKFGHYKEQ
ncbi:glycosyltransferase [Vibrio ponticus]|uniref:Glycosyltransferase n=1 Tax=Vibrio ponticus TaxID=265668 RepID=A0A3N3DZZ1_9VIBR|nr:glycosyltransferase [Vibrio ponticus]ROV60067.1 glycosyltransferase [Vibrio ponticus]